MIWFYNHLQKNDFLGIIFILIKGDYFVISNEIIAFMIVKEEYLHLLWKQKRIPFHLMKLVDGRNFNLRLSGIHNKESGPDFFDGEILLDNIIWRGNIEIHVKSSDWNLHKHQFDDAYNNVILHVVFENDKDIYVNSQLLPTLELKKIIDFKHYTQYLSLLHQKSDFVCSNFIGTLPPIYLESMKERVLINRLNRKIEQFINMKNLDLSQVLYSMLAKSFGMKVNNQPFVELTNRLPLKIIKRENLEYTTTLILGVSGNIEELDQSDLLLVNYRYFKQKYTLSSMPKFVWKKKGLRPLSFPINRLYQFSKVVSNFDFNTVFTILNISDMVDFFYKTLDFSHDINFQSLKKTDLSLQMKEMIIINTFVPFIWLYGTIKDDSQMKEKALGILEILQPEKNEIILKWKKLNVKIKKAYDSQSLLEIFNEFCLRKDCLNCAVGNKIFNK